MKPIVYMATNRVNGHRYIGVTKRGLEVRKNQHFYDARAGRKGCRALFAAINKHGESAFDWIVLFKADDFSSALKEEIRLISELNPEYNITKGGQGVVGVVRTPEWLARMSASLTGREAPKSAFKKGHVNSKESMERARAKKLGRPNPFAKETLKRTHGMMLELSARKRRYPVIRVDDGRRFPCLSQAMEFYGFNLTEKQINNGHKSIHRGGKFRKIKFTYEARP